ncbi:MAG TPA: phytanoyl-CoA dioxygenase family protein [Abditibacteriaceae bacterium]|nr:phytanoyl-CoA dioxygenase family protein [Abditibacteriaceae bacterium]
MPVIGQPPLTRLEKLNRYGYYTDENIFSEVHLGRLREALARLIRDGEAEYRYPHQDYFPNVIEFDDAFAEILDNPLLLQGLEEVIGPDVQLYANEVLVSKPTGQAQGWHRDKMSIGKHCPNMFLKVCLYTDEVPLDGGPTGVVPESHFDAYKGPEFFPHKIDYAAQPGSLLAFGANTMHRAGLHAEDRPPRPAMFFVFIPWWIKQATYYTGNRCQRLIETASPLRRQLLGIALRPDVSMDSFTAAE